MAYKTIKELFDEELEIGTRYLMMGMLSYINPISEKYRSGKKISEFEIYKFCDARKELLNSQRYYFEEGSRKRKRVERKYEGAMRRLRETDPDKGLPF